MGLLPLNISWDRAQTLWSAILNPIISSPLSAVQVLPNINLNNGTTIINHKLGRKIQGWWVISPDAAALIYQPVNSPNNSTNLTLVSSAAVVVNLAVY